MLTIVLSIVLYYGAAGGFASMAYHDWQSRRVDYGTWALALIAVLLLIVATSHLIALDTALYRN